MADTFFNPIDIAISDGNSNPPTGFARLQVKSNGKLHVKALGVETPIEPSVVTELRVDNGNASTTFNNYLLRLDFGQGGANINPQGTP